MTMRILLALALVFSLAGCGVKNDLVLPDGSKTAKGQKDPSKPPIPIGE
jgi:predicted small lipoprotein YifL